MESLWCDLGVVSDLSHGGMRLVCKKVPKSPVRLELHGCGHELVVDARIAWATRLGFRRHELGIEFVNLTPKQVRQLTTMAMTNRVSRLAS